MPRQSATQVDDSILDAAAGLFAAQGFAGTSLSQIATAVGYSKTGLLHRFASKQILADAVLADTIARLEAITEQVGRLAVGPARDVASVNALVTVALARPGQVALVLASFTAASTSTQSAERTVEADASLLAVDTALSGVFGESPDVDPHDSAAVERAARLTTALAGIAVSTTLAAEVSHHAGVDAAHRLLVTVALDALAVPESARS